MHKGYIITHYVSNTNSTSAKNFVYKIINNNMNINELYTSNTAYHTVTNKTKSSKVHKIVFLGVVSSLYRRAQLYQKLNYMWG